VNAPSKTPHGDRRPSCTCFWVCPNHNKETATQTSKTAEIMMYPKVRSAPRPRRALARAEWVESSEKRRRCRSKSFASFSG